MCPTIPTEGATGVAGVALAPERLAVDEERLEPPPDNPPKLLVPPLGKHFLAAKQSIQPMYLPLPE